MSVIKSYISPPKYIVILSDDIGGSEKRFFDIYCALVERDPTVHFVAPGMLLDKLNLPSGNSVVRKNIVRLEILTWSISNLVWELYSVIRAAPKGSLFHYPINQLLFLHLLRGHRLSMSLCDCTRSPFDNKKSKHDYLVILALHLASKVDVLSPTVYSKLRHKLSPGLVDKISLTPQGTYVNPYLYHVAEKKRREVIFMSRLEEQKGITDWLKLIPSVWNRMKSCSFAESVNFLICGDGSLGEMTARRTAELRSAGIPVSFLGMVSPVNIFAEGRVVLSLQRQTNFPSRVVGEALLSGCSVVIRDNGDSRQFGNMKGIVYVPDQLESDTLYDVLMPLLSISSSEVYENSKLIRNDAVRVFSSMECVNYFLAMVGG
jgi:glycosyltransferase involved in cell wall biosynthesis